MVPTTFTPYLTFFLQEAYFVLICSVAPTTFTPYLTFFLPEAYFILICSVAHATFTPFLTLFPTEAYFLKLIPAETSNHIQVEELSDLCDSLDSHNRRRPQTDMYLSRGYISFIP